MRHATLQKEIYLTQPTYVQQFILGRLVLNSIQVWYRRPNHKFTRHPPKTKPYERGFIIIVFHSSLGWVILNIHMMLMLSQAIHICSYFESTIVSFMDVCIYILSNKNKRLSPIKLKVSISWIVLNEWKQ